MEHEIGIGVRTAGGIYECYCGNKLKMSNYEERLFKLMPEQELPHDIIIDPYYRKARYGYTRCYRCDENFLGARVNHTCKVK